MKMFTRLLAIVALSTFLAACGGSESDDLAADASAARGGKKGTGGGGTTTPPPTSGAYVTATNSVYSGYTTVSFYPGSAADGSLWAGIRCYQNGTLVLSTDSWELHYAVQSGLGGYAFLGDHYDVRFGPLRSGAYTGGAASCTAYGYGSTGVIASSTFSVAAQ